MIRIRHSGKIESGMPSMTRVLTEHFRRDCTANGRQHLHFSVPYIPPSLNHNLKRTKTGFAKRGRVDQWQIEVMQAMGPLRHTWKPTGVTAAVLVIYSPLWLTLRRTVAKRDADNPVKATFDAIQQATEVPDELHWKFSVEKALAKRTRTSIWLYDLGDLVDYWD